jgi:sugar lactone lactonase YvrE
MKKNAPWIVFSMLTALIVPGGILAAGQKVETVDGVRVVHNPVDGKWGKTPAVKTQPVRVIGDVDTEDENFAFHMPSGLAIDAQGRLYVLDQGNNRVQVLDADGKYLKTIGRQGQGPGEFFMPNTLAFNNQGVLFVGESNTARIQAFNPDGKLGQTVKLSITGMGEISLLKSNQFLMSGSGMGGLILRGGGVSLNDDKAGKLPNLFKVVGQDGKIVREFGKGTDFGDAMVNGRANQISYILDGDENIYVAYPYQNRIEKYAADGRLLWKADRPLSYATEIKGGGGEKVTGSRGGGMTVSFKMPPMNRCAAGTALDGQGRLWVVTMSRQLRDNETVRTSMQMTVGGAGQSATQKNEGAVDLRNTDAFKLEVYDSEGVLLGSIPLSIFVDGIYIKGDRLFLLDKVRGVQFHEFKIVG